LKDNENIVLAGVHTVYAGQQVTPVKPLFDGESEVAAAGEVAPTEQVARAGRVAP
jgi:membrane fusion protein, multidrug efflux system